MEEWRWRSIEYPVVFFVMSAECLRAAGNIYRSHRRFLVSEVQIRSNRSHQFILKMWWCGKLVNQEVKLTVSGMLFSSSLGHFFWWLEIGFTTTCNMQFTSVNYQGSPLVCARFSVLVFVAQSQRPKIWWTSSESKLHLFSHECTTRMKYMSLPQGVPWLSMICSSTLNEQTFF